MFSFYRQARDNMLASMAEAKKNVTYEKDDAQEPNSDIMKKWKERQGYKKGTKNETDTIYGVQRHDLVYLIEMHDVDVLSNLGGIEGIALSLHTNGEDGIDGHPQDIQRRKDLFGENNYPRRPTKTFWVSIWEAFQDTTLVILIICAIVSLTLGMITKGYKRGWYDGTSIAFAIIIIVIVTACSDYKQSLQFRKLNEEKKNMKIQVVRGGRRSPLSIYEIVVGDIVPLNIGDQVPADGLLIQSSSLGIDESSMTGESEMVYKDSTNPFLLSGCKVVDGFGLMLVTCVGINTEWGKVMSTLTDDLNEETPLQARLRQAATLIGKIGLLAACSICIMLFVRYFVTDYSRKTKPIEVLVNIVNIFSIAVTIIVVAVPEGLPLAVTLTLAYSMRKMMADRSLVRHLAACETMGSATTVCTDKTGTLTLNQMSVVRSWVGGKIRSIEDIKLLGDNVLLTIYEGLAQNSTGDVYMPKEHGVPEITGNPTEKATLSWGLQIGMNFRESRLKSIVICTEIFNSTRKRAGVVTKGGIYTRVHWKGAAEIILSMCNKVVDYEGKEKWLNEKMISKIKGVIDDMAMASLRCIALAYRQLEDAELPSTKEETEDWKPPETNLTFLLILGIKDPCRPGVREAVQACQKAGIKVRMVTGDSFFTAESIARECGILLPGGLVLEGKDFRHFNQQEMMDILPRLDVLARSSPTDKLLLVKKLKEMNEVVGVTGDGTNDAPALREADIGLSMGITGTEVAKESSDIIILDDNFASIVKVIRWGRSVHANIQKFIQFQLTVNIVALVINCIAAARSTYIPLNTVQLLWVNLIMDTMGALALATEPPSDELMKVKPVGRSGPLITSVMWRNIVGQALYQFLILLFLFFNGSKFLRLNEHIAEEKILLNTIIFNSFVFCQIFNEINCRKPDKLNVFDGLFKNTLFCGVVSITAIVQVLIVELLNEFFTTTRLHWKYWLICIGVGFASLPIGMLVKMVPIPTKILTKRGHGHGRKWQPSPVNFPVKSSANWSTPYQEMTNRASGSNCENIHDFEDFV